VQSAAFVNHSGAGRRLAELYLKYIGWRLPRAYHPDEYEELLVLLFEEEKYPHYKDRHFAREKAATFPSNRYTLLEDEYKEADFKRMQMVKVIPEYRPEAFWYDKSWQWEIVCTWKKMPKMISWEKEFVYGLAVHCMTYARNLGDCLAVMYTKPTSIGLEGGWFDAERELLSLGGEPGETALAFKILNAPIRGSACPWSYLGWNLGLQHKISIQDSLVNLKACTDLEETLLGSFIPWYANTTSPEADVIERRIVAEAEKRRQHLRRVLATIPSSHPLFQEILRKARTKRAKGGITEGPRSFAEGLLAPTTSASNAPPWGWG